MNLVFLNITLISGSLSVFSVAKLEYLRVIPLFHISCRWFGTKSATTYMELREY
jgi:hypothetical protein